MNLKCILYKIEIIAFSSIVLFSCEESKYQERNPLIDTGFEIIDCKSKTHQELLELFLLDFDEQIINETEIFELLQDSIDYNIRNGFYTIRSAFNDSSLSESLKLFYTPEDFDIHCYFFSSHLVYRLDPSGEIHYRWDHENPYQHYNDTIIEKMIDFKNPDYMMDYSPLKVDSFPKVFRPRKTFSLSINTDYTFYTLYAFKEFVLNSKAIISELRHQKAESYFGTEYEDLNSREKYFVNRFYPLHIGTYLVVSPPPPPKGW